MTPPEHTDLRQVGRGLARRRWTSVVTRAGVGAVLVALAARFGPAAALATALFVVAAVGVTAWLAVAENRRWRRVFGTIPNGGAQATHRRSRRRST